MKVKQIFIAAFVLIGAANTAIGQTNSEENTPPEVYKMVDHMPSPTFDIGEYFSKNIQYPDSAKKAGITGRVVVRFVVTETGNIQDATVLKGIGSLCDNEALRVVSQMPVWKPGTNKGKPVKVYFTMPINFALTD